MALTLMLVRTLPPSLAGPPELYVVAVRCCCRLLPQDLPWPELPEEVTRAFDVAYNNIRAFHEAQSSSDLSVQTMPGVTCRRVTRPINAGGANPSGWGHPLRAARAGESAWSICLVQPQWQMAPPP